MSDNQGAEFQPDEFENIELNKETEDHNKVKEEDMNRRNAEENGHAKEEKREENGVIDTHTYVNGATPAEVTIKTHDQQDEVEIKDKKKPATQNLVGILELFKFSTKLDVFLSLLGLLCAALHGTGLPLLIVVFGDMTDLFINNADLAEFFEKLANGTNHSAADVSANPQLTQDLITQKNMSDYYTQLNQDMMDTLLNEMRKYAIYYVLLGIGVMILAYGQVAFWLMAAFRQARCIRVNLFRAILRQEIGWFDTHEAGELNTRIADDVTKIQDGIGDKLGNFFQWFASFVSGIVIGFVYGWKLTLVILAFGPLLVLSGIVMTKLTSSFTGEELSAYAKAGAVADEVLGAIRTVVAFNGQEKECDRYAANLVEAKKFGIKKGVVGGGGMGLVYLIVFCVYAAAFAYGSKLFFDNEYTAGQVLIVFFCVLIGAFSLGNAAPNLQNLGTARGAAYSVYGLIDRLPPINSESPEGIKPETIKGEIEFRNVKFRYPAREEIQVLKGINLTVNPGQTVALVGSSGCGKSTTIQLLQRFYDVEEGEVLIDGKNIKDYNIRWMRTHIGVVSQEPVLFNTTIGENIRYGRDGVTQAEIEQAAREANAYDFISQLPKKFETLVGERGAQLSGGQKQRIAIARALVRNPKILLLDEATSALDTESEAIVQSALDKARKGRTTLVVAHRLSTIRTADVIAGFDQGVIVEQGTHEELMKAPGVYNKLCTTQTAYQVDEEDEEEEPGVLERKASRRQSMKRSTSMMRSMSVVSETGTVKEEEEKVEDPDMTRVLKMNVPEWPYMVAGCVAALTNGAIQPAFAIIFAEILGVFAGVDKVKGRKDALMFSYLFFLIGVLQGSAMLLQSLFFAISGENLTIRLRQTTFRALLRQEMTFFDDPKNSVGSLTTRLAVDASAVQGATGARMGTMLQALGGIGTGLIIGFIYSWQLTLCVLAFAPCIMIAGMIQMKILAGYSQEGQKSLEESGRIASEAVNNIRTVQTLSVEPLFLQNYSHSIQGPYKKSLLQANLNGMAFAFSQGIIFFAYAACFYLGAYLVSHKGLHFENMFRVFMAIVFGAMAAGQTSHLAPDYSKAKTGATRIFRLLDRVPAIDSFSTEGKKLTSVSGNIEFSAVEFNYPTRPSVKILQGLSLSASTGQTVALVGSSGCGKSTSIQLMERFYDPLGGVVKLDGEDIKDLNIQWLRSQISLVSQEPILFDCSIRENIAYGDNSREVSMEDVIEAAKNANIHQFISNLPQGYETRVGDKGTQLSGGQKQRIAIARALVRNPKILLLDEATSALDTESEKVVQEALDKAQEGRTSIVIAHRLSTIQNADKIAVVSNGTIAEQGKHYELLTRKGFYYKLNQAQLKRH